MKILILTVDYPPIEGGIATVTLQLSRAVAALGHEVTVVAPSFPDMDDFDAAEPCSVIRFKGYAYRWARFFPMLATAWRHFGDADLILAMNVAYGGLISRLLPTGAKTRVINFAYAYEFLKFGRNPILGGLLRSVYRNCDHTVAISTFTAHKLVDFGAPAERIAVIRPGAAIREPHTREALETVRLKYELFEENILLAVGRFIPRKGHMKLVLAMPNILERFPHTQLILVGRGPCHEECVQKAAALGIEHAVLCPGHVPEEELEALYQLCTVFALPTGDDGDGQVEGFGLVFTEAHAWGKPVIAGKAGGVVDAVKQDETGLLIDSTDPDALESAVIALLQDPERARRLGAMGRKRVEEELNWTWFAERILDLAHETTP